MTHRKPILHFSIDDVFHSLYDDTAKYSAYRSFLDEIHQMFGIDISLYIFLEDGQGKRIQRHDIPRIRQLFATKPWLHAGPHAVSYSLPFHAQPLPDAEAGLITSIDLIHSLVPGHQVAEWLRLHYFSEMHEFSAVLKKHGYRKLFTTDNPSTCYRLPDVNKRQLVQHGTTTFNGMTFIRSLLRVESLLGLSEDRRREKLNEVYSDGLTYGYISIFTHECELLHTAVRDATRDVLSFFLQKING